MGTQAAVGAFFDRLRAACQWALENVRSRGEVSADVVVEEEAAWITTTLTGLFVLMRARADPAFLQQTGLAAQRHLNTLRPAAAPKGAG